MRRGRVEQVKRGKAKPSYKGLSILTRESTTTAISDGATHKNRHCAVSSTVEQSPVNIY